MTGSSNRKFCYREVDFYETAYMGFIFMKRKDDDYRMLYPLELVYEKTKAVKKRIMKMKLELDKLKKNAAEVYGAMIIKIRLNRTSPLKKEFWTTETKEKMLLDDLYRIRQYLKMFDNGGEKLYKIMVMPAFYDVKKKKWTLTNWLPVKFNITDKDLAKIAIMSDEIQVDNSAKNMALYTIEWVKGFDLDTGNFIKSKKEVGLERANC